VVANPVYRARSFTLAFDREERLSGIRNWYFLTGSLAALSRTWAAYGVQVQPLGGGAMVAHSDNAYVIDARGRLRAEFGSDPGSDGTSAASLATLVTQEMRSLMAA